MHATPNRSQREEVPPPRRLSAWAERYLRFLGVEVKPPSLAALAELAHAHLLAVPFENVTTLLRFRDAGDGKIPPLDPEALLDGWEARRGGGLCYEVTTPLGRLLRELGYACRATGGAITFPASHQALVVTLAGREYLVDVGNGAPLFAPIPLGETHVVEHLGLRYRFRPGDEPRTHLQERWIAEQWTPFCVYDLRAGGEDALQAGYEHHHTPGQLFVSELRLVRCAPDEVVVVNNDELTRFGSDSPRKERLEDTPAYERAARDLFGLPNLPIRAALEVLGRQR